MGAAQGLYTPSKQVQSKMEGFSFYQCDITVTLLLSSTSYEHLFILILNQQILIFQIKRSLCLVMHKGDGAEAFAVEVTEQKISRET